MNKITDIHLNGKAFKLEEAGYQALRHYLQDAEAKLVSDPDAKEIITDLEQAIADKCSGLLKGDKDVVTSDEVLSILKDMGEVEAEYDHSQDAKADESTGSTAGSQANSSASTGPQKRLYLIPDGAVIAGVCKGLSVYTGIDVRVIRLLFVIFTFFGGSAILIYLIMMVFIPQAKTSTQIAEAYGRPVTAQEIVESGKDRLAEISARIRKSDPAVVDKFLYAAISVLIIMGIVAILSILFHPWSHWPFF